MTALSLSPPSYQLPHKSQHAEMFETLVCGVEVLLNHMLEWLV